jgi:hypothetical protein
MKNFSRMMGLLPVIAISLIALTSATKPKSVQENITTTTAKSKIQVAILLDVSNSMDGLIQQAKAQLWNMVSLMGKANQGGVQPDIEIALYEYGRSSNNSKDGYVKQINGFTTDLDQVSKNLFNLSTNGGDEYCGQVIFTSLDELKWDPSPTNYKVIFISGNEDFLQGSLHYTKACAEANKKGVIVNTIYCGDRAQGIREHWNLNAECGQGSYTNINPDAELEEIATPYDSLLFVLNEKFNGTYMGYGSRGVSAASQQVEVDKMNKGMSASVMAKRVAVKGNKSLYKNEEWDLVDAMEKDADVIKKIDRSTLADSLKTKSDDEIKQIVRQQAATRGMVSKEIEDLNQKREEYIRVERAKAISNAANATLESEVEKIIKKQAKQFNIVIE